MIEVKCSAPDSVLISQLTKFQGDLKKRTNKDIKSLINSIKEEGLLMPFAVWESPDKQLLILDGHGRYDALYELALEDKSVLEQQFPCIKITAVTEDQARKALLQITSSYGKITKEGAVKFCAKIPGYRAPSINKFVNKVERPRRAKAVPNAEVIIRISVPVEKANEVKNILGTVGYIKVLG